MILTGDDSQHHAEMAKGAAADPAKAMLRVPVRVTAPDGTVHEGDGVIDTGAACSCVHGDFPKTGQCDQGICYCGHVMTVERVDVVLTVGEVEIRNPLGFPPDHCGALALIGLDVLSQCRFVYDGGKFTLEKSQ